MNILSLAQQTIGLNFSGRLFTQSWFNTMWLSVWQGALILAVVGMMCRLYPKLPPAIRIWLWRISFVKCLILLWHIPQQSLPVLPEARAFLAQMFPNYMVADLPTWFHVKNTLSGPLFLLWLALFIYYMVQLGRALAQVRLWRRTASPAPEQIGALVADLSRQMHLRKMPRILVSEDIPTPMATGIFRPVVLVPVGMLGTCTYSEMQMIMAHELAHIKRRDLLWNWLPTLSRMFFGFNPLMHYAVQELNTAQEAACDQIALSVTGGSPSTYGYLLLSMTAQKARFNPRCKLATSMASAGGRALKQRINQLKPVSNKMAAAYAIIGVFLLVVLPFRLTPGKVQSEISQKGMVKVEYKQEDSFLIVDRQNVDRQYKISSNGSEKYMVVTTAVR